MRALLLAAGEGTRLRPLTENTPKPMLMVAGRPLIHHTICALRDVGIDDIVVLLGYRPGRIRDSLGDGSSLGVSITYVEQRERLGTAHAIGMARGVMDGPFLALAGDVIVDAEDLRGLIAARSERGAAMAASRVPDPRSFGVIEETDGRLVRIVEKPEVPPSDLINASMYALPEDVFDRIDETPLSPRGEYEITDTLTSMADRVTVHPLSKGWVDIGRPWDLLDANRVLMDRMTPDVRGTVEEGAHLHGTVVVEEGARVRSGAYIEGPVFISRGCDVGPNCHLRPYTCLGPDCRVGNAVELKAALIMGRTNVPHHSYVGDSVIGTGCNLGSGTKVANLRFDDAPVRSSSKGVACDTGRRKLGVIMGDGVKTGINAMIAPGTVIHGGAVIGPGAKAYGEIAPGAKVL